MLGSGPRGPAWSSAGGARQEKPRLTRPTRQAPPFAMRLASVSVLRSFCAKGILPIFTVIGAQSQC